MNQSAKIAEFRRLHGERPLVLPNAWDAASARIMEQAGARAIATTSTSVSWSHGCLDGQKLTRDEMLAAIGRVVRAVEVPVTSDIESGYGSGTPQDVAETVRLVAGLGVCGNNLEDSPGRGGQTLLDREAQAERIVAAGAAGDKLVINARIDVFMFEVARRNPGSRRPTVAPRSTARPAQTACSCPA